MQVNSSSYPKNGASMKDYNIAGHRIRIDFRHCTDCEALLPNLSPFLCKETVGVGENPVLTITIAPVPVTSPEEETEIGRFDVGGCLHEVYRTSTGGYRFEIHDTTGHLCGRMVSDADFSHCLAQAFQGSPSQRAYGLNNCLMMAFAFATATMDTVLIHSSVIRCNGRGYLMTAPSGTGKSTHTRLWYDHIPGCDLMNDDNPVIRILPDGRPMVYGSPWSGKTPCYRNISAPIGGIVRLYQRPQNSIRRLQAVEAFYRTLPACSNMKWDTRVYNGVCDSVTKFIQSCGIWELGCLPNGDAAILCHDTISKDNH